MSNDDRFWLGIWGIIVIGIILLSIVFTSYDIQTNKQILQTTKCEQIVAIGGTQTERVALYCATKGNR